MKNNRDEEDLECNDHDNRGSLQQHDPRTPDDTVDATVAVDTIGRSAFCRNDPTSTMMTTSSSPSMVVDDLLRNPNHEQRYQSPLYSTANEDINDMSFEQESQLDDDIHHSSDYESDIYSENENDDDDDDDDEVHQSLMFHQLCEETLVCFTNANSNLNIPHSVTKHHLQMTYNKIRSWLTNHPSIEERSKSILFQSGTNSTSSLHLLCQYPNINPPIDIIQTIIQSCPNVLSCEDASGWIPLHYACATGMNSLVLKLLVDSYPQGRVCLDRQLRTPLHFAFYRGNGHDIHLDATLDHFDIQDDFRDDEQDTSNNDDDDDDDDDVDSYHYKKKLLNTKEKAILNIIRLFHDTKAERIPDSKGMLPIHYAAAYGCSKISLKSLIQLYPECITRKDMAGRNILHYAMANAHRYYSPSMIQYLLLQHRNNFSKWNTKDEEGNVPLYLLSVCATKVHQQRKRQYHSATTSTSTSVTDASSSSTHNHHDIIHQTSSENNIIQSLNMYLNSEPPWSTDLLTILQFMPKWLRDVAITNPYTQHILNVKIAKSFPTSVLMLDVYFYICSITCFYLASQDHITFRFTGQALSSYTNPLIYTSLAGASYFLICELAQIISMIFLGTFQKWILHPSNWVDTTAIVLLFYYCFAMLSREKDLSQNGYSDLGSREDLRFRTGVAFTLSSLWIAVVNFLKSTLLDFAVFFETILSVTRRLFIFMLALGVILIAFAEVFWILFRNGEICRDQIQQLLDGNDGDGDGDPFPHCTFQESMLKVFTMMVGAVGEVNRYSSSLPAQIFFVIFSFLVVILLSNVLIAIVTENYSVIKNERGLVIFWSNRLDFVAETDAILAVGRNFFSGIQHLCCCCFGCLRRRRGISYEHTATSDEEELDVEYDTEHEDPTECSNVDPSLSGHEENGVKYRIFKSLKEFYMDESSEEMNICEKALSFILKAIIIIIVAPCWFVLGLVTAGYLWPFQFREWVLVSMHGKSNLSKSTEQVERSLTSLSENDKLSKLQRELRQAEEELLSVRREFADFQAVVGADLSELKNILSAVLAKREIT